MGHWIPDQIPLISGISPCPGNLCPGVTPGAWQLCPGITANLGSWVTPPNHRGTKSVPCGVEAAGISPRVKPRVYGWDWVPPVRIYCTGKSRAWRVSWVLLHLSRNGVVTLDDAP